MFARPYVATIFVIAIIVLGGCPVGAQERLDPEAIKAALRTIPVEENNYVLFLVTLVDQGRLPRVMFDTSLRWARNKGYHRFQFFKRAVIAQADRAGLVLPNDTPPLRASIQGKVVQRVLLIDVPVPLVDVQIVGTSNKTKTNLKGEFTFSDLPWGVFTVEADGSVIQLLKKVSVQVKLPLLPNDATTVTLKF